jgi:hypothetical protein
LGACAQIHPFLTVLSRPKVGRAGVGLIYARL